MGEIKIDGVAYNDSGEPLTEEEFSRMFLEWLESKGLSFGGVIVVPEEDDIPYRRLK